MSDRRLWTNQEDQIIINLVQFYGLKKWTTVADQMKKNFPQLARSSKQIRQRWYNHLDPEINKKPWTIKEEEILFQAHKKYGNKWKEIAKHLQSRTDNSAKNHFYSTLRRSLRRINKFLGFKNSTNQMKVLKPSILSKLVESADYNQQSRALVNGIFQFANIKPSKSKKKSQQDINIEKKDFFRDAIEKIISFNNKYGQNRQVLKKKKSNRGLNLMKIVPQQISPKRQQRSNKTSSKQKSQEVPTSFHSSKNQIEQSYQISIISRQSWQQSAEKNCRMLPQLQKPQDQEIMCIEQNPPEFYHFNIQTQKIFQEIEIGFINN